MFESIPTLCRTSSGHALQSDRGKLLGYAILSGSKESLYFRFTNVGILRSRSLPWGEAEGLAQNDSSFGCGHEATLRYPPSGLFVSGTRVSAGGHIRRFQKSWRRLL